MAYIFTCLTCKQTFTCIKEETATRGIMLHKKQGHRIAGNSDPLANKWFDKLGL